MDLKFTQSTLESKRSPAEYAERLVRLAQVFGRCTQFLEGATHELVKDLRPAAFQVERYVQAAARYRRHYAVKWLIGQIAPDVYRVVDRDNDHMQIRIEACLNDVCAKIRGCEYIEKRLQEEVELLNVTCREIGQYALQLDGESIPEEFPENLAIVEKFVDDKYEAMRSLRSAFMTLGLEIENMAEGLKPAYEKIL